MVDPGHAPIPSKLVSKVTGGHFDDLADLLSLNLRAVESEPQTFLDGKLVVLPTKRRQAEIHDILTSVEHFTIYQMVMCSTHPHRWADLTRYKLLVIQTAQRYPGQVWLEYDLAFRKDATATALLDWAKMNSDLYIFHLRSAPVPSTYQLLRSSASSSATLSLSHERRQVTPYCHFSDEMAATLNKQWEENQTNEDVSKEDRHLIALVAVLHIAYDQTGKRLNREEASLPSSKVSKETLKRAIRLANYFTEQRKILDQVRHQ